MRRQHHILAAIVLLSMVFTSCVPDLELAGHAWSASGNTNYDGDPVTIQTDMICTSTSEGTLFLSMGDLGEPMDACIAMPFTYTWDDNRGSATATLQLPEYLKGRKLAAKGTYTFLISMSYTKTEGLVITSNDIERVLGFPCTSTILTESNYAKPASMSGTSWTLTLDEEVDHTDENGLTTTEVYQNLYNLEFTSSTAARLSLTVSDDGNIDEYLVWDVSYDYTGGVGHTTITFDEETVQGAFFLPDANHLTFTDGINRLNLTQK